MVGQLGPAFSIREILDPTKFQIPLPYLAPFCLAFDGLPKVGGRPPHPQREYYPPPKLPGCVTGLYQDWNTQVVYTESEKQQGLWESREG